MASATNVGSADNTIKNMRARLERWELSHLRALAADLHSRLEAAEARAECAERARDDFARECEYLQEKLQHACTASGGHLALTMQGQLVAVCGGVAA